MDTDVLHTKNRVLIAQMATLIKDKSGAVQGIDIEQERNKMKEKMVIFILHFMYRMAKKMHILSSFVNLKNVYFRAGQHQIFKSTTASNGLRLELFKTMVDFKIWRPSETERF